MCSLYEYDMHEEHIRPLVEHSNRIGTNWPGPVKVYPNYEAPGDPVDGDAAGRAPINDDDALGLSRTALLRS